MRKVFYVLIFFGGIVVGVITDKFWVDNFANFLSWPGVKAPGGLVQFLILAAILVSAAFIVWQLMEDRKRREWELLTRLGDRWDSKDLASARELGIRLGPNGVKDVLLPPERNGEPETKRKGYFELCMLGGFFEELGIGVEKNYIKPEVVDLRLGSSVLGYGKLFSEYINAMRERGNLTVYEHFQALTKKIADRRKISLSA